MAAMAVTASSSSWATSSQDVIMTAAATALLTLTSTSTFSPSPTAEPTDLPPNDPRSRRYVGPWFQQQIILSLAIGIPSIIAFSFFRRKYKVLYAPRTKIKGLFSPAMEAYTASHEEKLRHVFAWILPTIKINELDVMHNLGIDAVVLLDFLKMGFWLFFTLSVWACVVLMPVNYLQHGSIDGVAPSEERGRSGNDTGDTFSLLPQLSYLFKKQGHGEPDRPLPQLPLPSASPQSTLYHFTHLLSTYVVSLLVIRAIYRNYQRFIKCRQLHALQILDSIPARTVEIRQLPTHLRDERKLAEYFEAMGYGVESVAVVHDVKGLGVLLDKRAKALYALEQAWAKYLGNPTRAKSYDPEGIYQTVQKRIEEGDARADANPSTGTAREDSDDVERAPLLTGADSNDPTDSVEAPEGKKRPQMHISAWNPFSHKVDALKELERQLRVWDREVSRYRSEKISTSQSTGVGFVTFHDATSAQILAQSVHYPEPGYCTTRLAPEPRDIIWSNVATPPGERRMRQILISALVFIILLFYIPPLTAVASFLKPEAIEKYVPWLHNVMMANPRLGAFVQNFLPTILVVGFNSLLPIVFEWTAYFQGIRARSQVEHSVLKKYYLFLLVSVVFIFLITSTAWGVLTDIANNPVGVLGKLSDALPGARNFSLSYIVLQSLGVVPLQLLQLPTVILRGWQRIFTNTPREHAELNAPPQLYIGTAYPQALIIFTMAVLYSIVSPIILVFGCLFFGVSYIVNKYKILFVFYKSYESKGEAWPLSASRCVWSLALFQLFQLSLFIVRKQALLALLTAPLLITTVYLDSYFTKLFAGLSQFISLSSIAEISSSEGPARLGSAAAADVVTKAQLQEDDTLFVAERDRHTDYREPPAQGYYSGVLNTGRRRYGHPALTGVLPELWLPVTEAESHEASETEAAGTSAGAGERRTRVASEASHKREPVILSLRSRASSIVPTRRDSSRAPGAAPKSVAPVTTAYGREGRADSPNIWSDGTSGPQGTSNGAGPGEALAGDEAVAPVRLLPDTSAGEDETDVGEEGVYMHRSSSFRDRRL